MEAKAAEAREAVCTARTDGCGAQADCGIAAPAVFLPSKRRNWKFPAVLPAAPEIPSAPELPQAPEYPSTRGSGRAETEATSGCRKTALAEELPKPGKAPPPPPAKGRKGLILEPPEHRYVAG